MTEEVDILKIVSENPSISQRKISEQTGISLGQVNFLIKKCVKKGLIKIEGQTPKSIKYNLTPKGMTEKVALTLEYVKISYGVVIALTDKIRSLADQYELEGKKIYVYGYQDEMMEICKLALGDREVNYKESDNIIAFGHEFVIFHWEEKAQNISDFYRSKAVNILL